MSIDFPYYYKYNVAIIIHANGGWSDAGRNPYTPEELAGKLKLSKYTVYEMIKRGDIQAHHIGRSIRISETQLELYFASTRKSENVYDAEIISMVPIHFADKWG